MNKTLFDKADFLKNLFDTVPSLMFVVDSDVRILHLNSAAMSLLAVDKKAVLLKRGGEALHCVHCLETPEGCGRSSSCKDCVIRNSVNKAFQGEKVHRETTKTELVSEAGISEIHFMVTASPLRYEEKDFVLLIMEDITGLKKTEEELKRKATELEAANQELEAFSYSVSHDLKAPLRSICGFSDALMEDFATGLDEEARDYLTRIRSAGLRMSDLVDDLLVLSRVTRDKLRHEPVDLSALAGAVAGELKKSCSDRALEVIITPGLRATGDGRLLRIVLENLINNAVKYTSKHPSARIEFGASSHEGKPAYFVRDDGSGFDMAGVGKLFSPFQRLHDSSQFPGSGIGLATVRRIIHRHGGRTWAEGEVEKGAAFYFTL